METTMKLFNMTRVETTEKFIMAELLLLLSHSPYSHLSKSIAAACPTYKQGLTNGERLLATLRALSKL
jgi:hypothetical protein